MKIFGDITSFESVEKNINKLIAMGVDGIALLK